MPIKARVPSILDRFMKRKYQRTDYEEAIWPCIQADVLVLCCKGIEPVAFCSGKLGTVIPIHVYS